MTKTVAIVGTSQASREMANMEPPEVEIWGLQSAESFLDRYDRWFQIHNKEAIDLSVPTEKNEFYRTCGIPVYVTQSDHCLPTGVMYPFAQIGYRFRDYWTNTIAYMLALAVHEEYEEIHMWGVDMATGTEYAQERPCVEFWLGLAAGRGITITVPDSSPLLKGFNGAYGLSNYLGVHKQQIEDELGSLERQRRVTTDPDVLQAINGAEQMCVGLLGNLEPKLKGVKIEYVDTLA